MLTPAQLTTLKAFILADSELNAHPNNADGNQAIALALSATASPDYWVWRTFVSDQEMYEGTGDGGTAWSWTIFIGRSQGEQDAWRQMVNMAGGVNPSLANVRTGIADIFSGTGSQAQRDHLLALGRRRANRAEKLFAINTPGSGAGRGTTADPDTLTVQGVLSADDVQAARNLP